MQVFFPSTWSYEQQQAYLQEKGLKSMGNYTLRGYYPNGIRETKFSEIIWSIMCWLP